MPAFASAAVASTTPSTRRRCPYPGLATDLQPQLAAFLTQANGASTIHERVYDNRLLYIGELRKMGANVVATGQTAIITGPTKLTAAPVSALDVRAGSACVLAALVRRRHHRDRRRPPHRPRARRPAW